MGIFKKWKEKKAAEKAEMTIDEYAAYLAFNSERETPMSIDEYKLYVQATSLNMTVEQYLRYRDHYKGTYSPEDFLRFLSAEKEGFTLQQYDEYYGKYAGSLSKAEYLELYAANQAGLSLKDYREYKSRFSQLSVSRFKDLLKARSLGLTLEQYDDYRRDYSTWSVEKYKRLCEARAINLTLEEYEAYSETYRKKYAPERFHEFFVARKHGLSLDQYDEWKSEYQTKMALPRFVDLLEARKKNMTLEEYDEYLTAKAKGMTVKQYRDYLLGNRFHLNSAEIAFYRKAEACDNLPCYVSTIREIQIAQMANVSRVIVDEKKMTDVPDRAFYNSSFEEIILPWGVATIGAAAFAKCYNLKSIIIPGTVEEVKAGVFEGCNSLEEIILLNGIKTINITGWDKLPSLKSVVSNNVSPSFVIDQPKEYVYKHHYSADFFSKTISATTDDEKNAKMLRISVHLVSFFDLVVKDFVNLEYLIVDSDIRSIKVENCPRIRVIIASDIVSKYFEFYKNGNIKNSDVYDVNDFCLPSNLPNLKFFIVKYGNYVKKYHSDSNCPSLIWFHGGKTDIGISDIIANKLIAVGTVQQAIPSSVKKVLRSSLHVFDRDWGKTEPILIQMQAKESSVVEIVNVFQPKDYYRKDESNEKEIAESLSIYEGCREIKDDRLCQWRFSSLHIPSTVRFISKSAFQKATRLHNVVFAGYGKHCIIEQGAFDKCPIECVEGMDLTEAHAKVSSRISLQGITEVSIPSSITVIEKEWYSSCGIREIVIPKSVKEIRERAFRGCRNLNAITIQGKKTAIAADAFESCSNVNRITWESDVISNIAGNTGFPNVRTFTIPTGLGSIPNNCFAKWGLQEIVIPSSVYGVGNEAFRECKSLKSITIQSKSTAIASNAFADCINVDQISWEPKNLSQIAGDSGFPKVHSFTIGDACETVPEKCFNNWGLQEINLPASVTCVDKEAFCDCSELTTVNYCNKQLSVQAGAFKNCVSLISFNTPESQTFYVDDELSFCKDSFSGCTSINRVIFDCKSIADRVSILKQIPVKHVLIRKSVSFADFSAIASVPGIETIGFIEDSAELKPARKTAKKKTLVFSGSLVSLSLPECVDSIAGESFRECVKLQSIWLSSTLHDLPTAALASLPKLKEIRLHADLLAVIDGTLFSKKTKLIPYGEKSEKSHRLSINDETISSTYVPESERWWYTEVSLSANCRAIDAAAFAGFINLRKIELFEGLRRCSKDAFKNCILLSSIELPDSVEEMEENAFEGCTGLKRVKLPGKLKRICKNTFKDCTSLESAENFRRVGYVEPGAFENCTALKEVVFSTEIFSVDHAFTGCASLESLVIPVDIAVFKEDLSLCKNLKQMILPQVIDDFACKTAMNNQITVVAKRGSTWKNLLSVFRVNYMKAADYEDVLRTELGRVGLLDTRAAEKLTGTAVVAGQPQSHAETSTKPRTQQRASWSTKATDSAYKVETTPTESEIEKTLKEIHESQNRQSSYRVEDVDIKISQFNTTLPTERPGVSLVISDNRITNNVFSITVCPLRDMTGGLIIVTLDDAGRPTSKAKKVIFDREKTQEVQLQIQLKSGVSNGKGYVIAITADDSEKIISLIPIEVDIAFSIDQDFEF